MPSSSGREWVTSLLDARVVLMCTICVETTLLKFVAQSTPTLEHELAQCVRLAVNMAGEPADPLKLS